MSDFLLLFCNWLFGTFIRCKSQSSGWYSPSFTLPYNDSSIAVGAYNDTIFLLGGVLNRKQMTEYKIATDTLIDNGDFLTTGLYANGQICAQIDVIMYIIDATGSFLSTFNMMTKEYTNEWHALDANTATYQSCLASSDDHLFISGGADCLETLYVLHVSSLNWITNTPSMQKGRSLHACIVYNNYLWAFAGLNQCTDTRIFTNERINIVDIAANEWNYIDSLPSDPFALRAVAWQQNIFLVGGARGDFFDAFLDSVYIMDAVTGTVSTSQDRLVYSIAYTASIQVHNVIYAFGGWCYDRQRKDTFMIYEIPAIIPSTTEAPSDSPTKQNVTIAMETTNDLIPSSSTESSSTTNINIAHNSSNARANGANSTSIPIEFSNTTFTVNNTTKSPPSMLSATVYVLLITICFCCSGCNTFFCCKYLKSEKREKREHDMDEIINIQKGTHEMHRIVPQYVDFERELVESWLRYTVRLPIYIDLFLSQGYENMESIQAIEEDDLRELGIKMAGHRTVILGEIKLLQDAQFVVKGITRGVDGNKTTTTGSGLPLSDDHDYDSDGIETTQTVGEQNEECMRYTAEGDASDMWVQ